MVVTLGSADFRPAFRRHLSLRPVVLLSCLLVPLAFAPWRDEVFAPVKLQVLQGLNGVGLLLAGTSLALGRRFGVRLVPGVDLPVVAFGVLNVLAWAHSEDAAASGLGVFPEYQGLATVLAYLVAYALARVAYAPSAGPAAAVPEATVAQVAEAPAAAVPEATVAQVPEAPAAAVARQPVDAVFGVLTVVTGLVGGYATLQRLGLDPLWGFAERPFATVGQANSMAAMLVAGLPAVAAACARRRGWPRAAAALAGVLGAAGLAASLSRGGWLAVVIAGAAGLALYRPPSYRRSLAMAATVIAVLVLVLTVLPAGRLALGRAHQRVVAVADTSNGSVGKHLALARIGLAVTLDHPWLGIGQDVFPEVAQRYADARLSRHDADLLRPRLSESPHNALLSISSGAGVPAVLAYLVFHAAVARRLLAARRSGGTRAGTVLMIQLGYLVSSLFMTPEVSSTVVLWMVLGAAVASVS
jgi:O-antigen ligase